jgi:ribonuclease P protein component
MGINAFRPAEKIRKRPEYLSIYQHGTRTYARHFTIVAQKNELGYGRLGITVSKKVGDAVCRNRVKRLIREFFRLNKTRLVASRDIVVIGKKGMPRLSYQDVCKELAVLVSNRVNE